MLKIILLILFGSHFSLASDEISNSSSLSPAKEHLSEKELAKDGLSLGLTFEINPVQSSSIGNIHFSHPIIDNKLRAGCELSFQRPAVLNIVDQQFVGCFGRLTLSQKISLQVGAEKSFGGDLSYDDITKVVLIYHSNPGPAMKFEVGFKFYNFSEDIDELFETFAGDALNDTGVEEEEANIFFGFGFDIR